MSYARHFSTRRTPQSQPIPNTSQVPNNAGGYAFPVDDWTRLDRFLILGAEGGTYYVNEKELTIRNAQAVTRCIKQDGKRVVQQVVDISTSSRAPKNDPALFVLAMCAGMGDANVRKAALDALHKVARIGTHLFHFAEYVQAFRGWGRGLRNAVAQWYNGKDARDVAYQVVKYQQRDGWSHRDLLRLAHPKAPTSEHNSIYQWATKGWDEDAVLPYHLKSFSLIYGYEKVKKLSDERDVVDAILKWGLTREMIPTQWLNSCRVWEALLESMPMTAMIRNLGKMTNIKLIQPMSTATANIINRLRDAERLRQARIHPLSVLVALRTYAQGHGMRGKLAWSPVGQVIDALDEAFYLSFGNVESTGKRTMLALDVSGSMNNELIAGMPLAPRVASAAMAMVTARTEPNYVVTIFSSSGTNFMQNGQRSWYGRDGIGSFLITPRERLDDIVQKTDGLPFGGTDCALPMLYAIANQWLIDTFIIYTDNETWAGSIHPVQALNEYRQKSGIGAKLVVVGMTSSGFTIADPNDAGMMDVVGFDTATPQIISDFARNP